MNDLVIYHQVPSSIIDHQRTHAAPPISKGTVDLLKQIALINDAKTLFHISCLSDADKEAILTDVKDTILLVDWSKHGVHDNGWSGVGDKARFFLELAGEEINTEEAILASLRAAGDADNLAGTTLEDQEVADPDVVAWDGNGGRTIATADTRFSGFDADGFADTAGTTLFGFGDDFIAVVVAMVMMMEWVEDAVGGALDPATEGVVVAFVVVVTHVAFVFWFGFDVDSSFAVYSDVCFRNGCIFPTTIFVIVVWVGTAAVVAFSDVELGLEAFVVEAVLSSAVDIDVDIDFSILVAAGGLTETEVEISQLIIKSDERWDVLG
jgi:hypothetical protein